MGVVVKIGILGSDLRSLLISDIVLRCVKLEQLSSALRTTHQLKYMPYGGVVELVVPEDPRSLRVLSHTFIAADRCEGRFEKAMDAGI